MYLVTVKLKKNPNHDPHNKITGLCPVSGFECTDVTGEHHTFASYLGSAEECRVFWSKEYHVTRIEKG
jgi:hypothetical protein